MIVVGADENGLGPRLGPLIATAVTLEVKRYRRGPLLERGAKLGIQDSKASSAFGRMRLAESLTLASMETLYGSAPRTADSLFADVSLDGMLGLRAPCPGGETRRQCWSAAPSLPMFGGSVEEGREILRALRGRGVVKLRRVRSVIVCAGVLNHELAMGKTKLGVDLGAFERLVLDARRVADDDVLAICGMVGGIRRYAPRFEHFRAESVRIDEERKGLSSYRIAGVGELRFEVKSDANHLPVAFASMVGKYLREVAMARLNRYYRAHDPELPEVSGYHDPKTRAMVEQTADLRRRLRIAEGCFERRG